MSENKFHKELEAYVDRVFFYCVKRCNTREDAEDLSQTILLEITIAINKGIIFNNFDYYIWAIVKNQYAKYQKRKILQREKMIPVEEGFLNAFDSNEKSVLNKIIDNEQFETLVAQMKLLSQDYSNILYGYYIEDKTLKVISEETNLPLGTVKNKLFTLRKKLKEVLKMERLPGKKAFLPKRFSTSMCENGNPYQLAGSLINKNILFHSYDNPCSLEDYSLELGISLPYIEDAVESLYNRTLLKKTEDERFITNFVILPKEYDIAQNTLIEESSRRYIAVFSITPLTLLLILIEENSRRYIAELKKICMQYFDDYKASVNLECDDQLLMWSLMFEVNASIEERVAGNFLYSHKTSSGDFDFHMTELIDGTDNNNIWKFSQNSYFSKVHGICGRAWPSHMYSGISDPKNCLLSTRSANGSEPFDLFAKLMKTNLKYSEFDDHVKHQINKYTNKNYLQIKNDKVMINFPYLSKSGIAKLRNSIKSADGEKLEVELRIICDKLKKLITNHIPKYLYNQIDYLIFSSISNIRSFVIDGFIEANLIRSTFSEPFQSNSEFKDEDHFVYNMIAWDC